ncbi:hypothetical protein [Mycolicibacterium mageritense]|uniref:hypothetical protein n=1 Tax=Mycolicibacterium mageritense TaxID=53462 RepID=UPI0011D6B3FE|nr:hypothetical protein [Mycolicibacterium mageritense]TXI56305.1 MAG: hypothetical protein E6Q55_29245 [Mycolicibacterium mageritense]
MVRAQDVFDEFHSYWAMQFARTNQGPAAAMTLEQRFRIGMAVKLYSARFAPGEFQTPALCYAATKMIRVVAQAADIQAEPVTVTFHAEFENRKLEIGAGNPRLTRGTVAGRAHHFWTGHEIVHLPAYGMVIDPTALQLSFHEPELGFVLPVVAAAPTRLRPGDIIDAELERQQLPATYRVRQANYDYRKMPHWPAIEHIALQSLPLVDQALADYMSTDEYRRESDASLAEHLDGDGPHAGHPDGAGSR